MSNLELNDITLKDLVNIINNSELYSLNDFNKKFEIPNCITKWANYSRYFNYSIAEQYYKLEDGILGVRGIYQVNSHLFFPEDINIPVEAFEGEEYTIIGYRRKK